jgi:hypothetical protein
VHAVPMCDTNGKRFVILLIDPSTGELEAFGPVDEVTAAERAAAVRASIEAGEAGEVGVVVLPLQSVNGRR